jgi:alpha-L-rhamnosidase
MNTKDTKKPANTSRREFLKEGALAGGGLAIWRGDWLPGGENAQGSGSGEGAIRPVALRCEYRENPLGIDVRQPRLSWVLQSTTPEARGQMQSTCQILTAGSRARLDSNQGDLWDTGKVESDRSTQVIYQGRPLVSRQQVWWKVRVWDRPGSVSPWSETASWSMGLLDRADWKGRWIGLDGGAGKPQGLMHAHWIWSSGSDSGTRYFRRVFTVPPDGPYPVVDALLFVIASGVSTVYLNGQEVGKGEGTQTPLSRDVTELLKPGPNVLAVAAAHSNSGPSGLIAALEMDFPGGEQVVIHTDQRWRVSQAKAVSWSGKGFRDLGWKQAKLIGGYGMAPWGELGWAEHRVLPARMLRKDFQVTGPVRRASLYLSGLGLSESWLNGQKISADVSVPALSDYDKRAFYLTYDVTTRLRTGENTLGVMLGNGRFFAPRVKIPPTRTFGYPKLLLQLEIEHSDGTTECIVSDETWKLTTDGPIRSNNVYDGEICDATKEMKGWSEPGFDDSSWQQAKAVGAPAGILSAQMIEPIRVMRTLKPVKITQPKAGQYIFDMGQNMVGWCRLTVSGRRGTKVTLRHAETLRPDGTLYMNNLRSARATDVYTLKGKGTEIYEPRFTYHGFRYVEMRGFPGKPGMAALEGRVVHDALPEHARFTTSDAQINRVYENVLWGSRGNYRSIPTDCPQRDERQGWLGDRSAESRGETYLFDVAAFYEKWVNDIADSQTPQGSVSDVCPAYWPLYSDNVTWPASFFIVAAHFYEQYGDRQVIRKHYKAMTKWMTHMQTYLKGDLMPRDSYGDWCPPPRNRALVHTKDPARDTDHTLLGTAYFFYLLRLMARNARLLGELQDARDFDGLAEQLRRAFNAKYFNPITAQYSNGSQTSSILPLAFGMVPESQRKRVLEVLVEKIKLQSGGRIAAGLIGCQWLMQLLSDNGHADLAYEIARQKTYPSWGYMTSRGATTVWELWNGDTAAPWMNSHNHLMLVGDLVTWFYENLAGIRSDPAQPGFKHIIMRPTPAGDLTFVKASHRSPHGEIVSEWRREGATFSWNVLVPVNTHATLFVPAKSADHVLERGAPSKRSPGVEWLRDENGAAVYQIGSGRYHFVSSLTS